MQRTTTSHFPKRRIQKLILILVKSKNIFNGCYNTNNLDSFLRNYVVFVNIYISNKVGA